MLIFMGQSRASRASRPDAEPIIFRVTVYWNGYAETNSITTFPTASHFRRRRFAARHSSYLAIPWDTRLHYARKSHCRTDPFAVSGYRRTGGLDPCLH